MAQIGFIGNTGQTLRINLFELNSDVLLRELELTEETNRKGLYLTYVGEPPLAGYHHGHVIDQYDNPIAAGFLLLADDAEVHYLERDLSGFSYWSRTEYHRDTLNSKDEYRTVWFRDATSLISGVSGFKIWVVDDGGLDRVGTELSPAAMTEIGSTHVFKYDATPINPGTGLVATTFATIDGQVRRWRQPFSRDS